MVGYTSSLGGDRVSYPASASDAIVPPEIGHAAAV